MSARVSQAASGEGRRKQERERERERDSPAIRTAPSAKRRMVKRGDTKLGLISDRRHIIDEDAVDKGDDEGDLLMHEEVEEEDTLVCRFEDGLEDDSRNCLLEGDEDRGEEAHDEE